ncbi:DUF6249 domain-containing protein [bacterium]|nr:DUF6249 domain-containing protein [bacterium]
MFDVQPVAIIGVMIPIVAMITGLIIVLFAMNKAHRTRELEHKERIYAMEQGYPLPMKSPQRKSQYPFAWPFIMMGAGLGLILIYVFADADVEAIGFGLILLFIGIGLFLSRFVGVRKNAENDDDDVKEIVPIGRESSSRRDPSSSKMDETKKEE